MEIQANSKLAEAAVAFQSLPVAAQNAIIETLKRLLSEREKYPVQQALAEKTTE